MTNVCGGSVGSVYNSTYSVSLCGLKLGYFCSPCAAPCSPSVHAESHCAPRLIFLSCICVCVCVCVCMLVCVFVLLVFTPLPPYPTPNLSNPLGLKKEIPPLCPGLLFLGVCASCVLQLLHSASSVNLQRLKTCSIVFFVGK